MITLDTVILPDELIWIDEFNWNPIRAEQKITLSGKRNLFESILENESGRPITLSSSDSWIDRQDLITLFNLTKIKDKIMTLILNDNSEYQVRFRHIDSPVIEYEALLNTAWADNDTIYVLTLKLEVA